MSSVYITEPPTRGKVILKTSNGDVDVELWPKEAPQACRNFIQVRHRWQPPPLVWASAVAQPRYTLHALARVPSACAPAA